MTNRRKAPKHSVTWMQQLAQEKRNKTEQELEYLVNTVFSDIRIALKIELKDLDLKSIFPESLEEIFGELYTFMDSKYTLENFWYVQRRVIHKAYGDPTTMASISQRPLAVPYWNPSPHRINISPMGLVKHVDEKTRKATYWDFIEPGAMIMLPETYTKGGKYSTVRGVAPQLKPLPRQIDNSIDLEPLTYTEWCTYGESHLTNCCNALTVWYDKAECLICQKCGAHAKAFKL